MSNTYIPERAMFIFAHPDDIEFSVAGTAAKWASQGCENTYVVITDGNVGSHDPDMSSAQLAQIRRQEQTAAAEVAGAVNCFYLGYDDGSLEPTLELRKQLVKLIRQYRPNAVVCGDPNMYYRGERLNHPDHRAAARAVFDAVFPACEMRLLYPEFEAEGIQPHKVNFVFITTDQDLNHYVDISETINTKLKALHQHRSQLGDIDYSDRLRERASAVGKQVGLAYAEAFRRFTVTPLPIPQEEIVQ
ncbi:MAG: PIG-L family deacetylase [Ardenticatenaceae bacterium]|nr:PIG-L family deacetylase [Anaerolineales bacterium]MCB8981327.1 PIG-L family deacetylase [Ardenticatenaceae bacterium]